MLLEKIKELSFYIQRGEQWRVRHIELEVAKLLHELAAAQDELFFRQKGGENVR